MLNLTPPLQPRNGHTLEILLVCRVSDPGPGKQDIRSLDDQEAAHRIWITARTELPFNITVLAGSGSGECLERDEYKRLIELIESNCFDLVLCEDLGRIVRRIHAHLICELCVDHGVRLIAVNDPLDTAQDGWQDKSIFAAWHHERSNRDTSNRIKRTLRNRFMQGGVVQTLPYGYVKPVGCKSDSDLQKDPSAEPVLKEWFRLLEGGATFSEIADLLNAKKVPTGPFCRNKAWDVPMVARISRNTLLKGVRQRNNKVSMRVNKTGRRKSVDARPEERLERQCPHLAFFDADYYDRVISAVNERNAKYRAAKDGNDPRRGRPRKQSPWPGNHLCCAVCGRPLIHNGLREKRLLMCSGAVQYRCWNSLAVDCQKAAQKIFAAVQLAIVSLPDFDQRLLQLVDEQRQVLLTGRTANLEPLQSKLRNLDRQLGHLTAAIKEHGYSEILGANLRLLEAERGVTARNLAEMELTMSTAEKLVVPDAATIRQLALEEFGQLHHDGPQFARVMRRLIDRIDVAPYRLIGGGAVVLRAKLVLNLAPVVPGASQYAELSGYLRRELQVDLFDLPQHVRFRADIVQLRAAGFTEREAARQVGITITAAQRAARLNRTMDEECLTDPYLCVTEPPADYGKLRRHRHPRYRFETLSDDRSA